MVVGVVVGVGGGGGEGPVMPEASKNYQNMIFFVAHLINLL